MSYNDLTEQEKLQGRLSPRAATPRNFSQPRNLAVVRPSAAPSNDAFKKDIPVKSDMLDEHGKADANDAAAAARDEHKPAVTLPGVLDEILQNDEPENTAEPVDFRTHAESNAYVEAEQISVPTGWGNMTLADKEAWINENHLGLDLDGKPDA